MIAFVDAPEFAEASGLVRLDFVSGDAAMPMMMTVHSLSHLVRRANRFLDEMAERQRGQVVEFPRT